MKNLIFTLFLVLISFGIVGCGKSNKDASITIYTRDTTSGTRDGFFSNIGFKEAVENNNELANGYVEVASNGNMINALKNDQYGIGYISLSSLPDSGLKGLNYNGVSPTEENVLNDTYALKRNFNYNTRASYSDVKVKQIVEAFVAYLGTKDAKATIKNNDGIVQINSSDPTWDSIKSNYPISNQDNSGITIKFGGSTSVEKIAKALSAEFSPKCGNFIFEHNHTGSGDAYKRTQGSEKDGSNYLDIAFASREYKISETEPLAAGTYGRICTDAIVAAVNNKNALTNITAETLVKIYDGTITLWKDVK